MTISNSEQKAIDAFVKIFGGSYQKLGALDVDYKIFDANNKAIAYVEVNTRVRTIRDAYPLGITLTKLAKLIDKRLNPVIIWSCDDGIIYGMAEKLSGQIIAQSQSELMVYYEKQKGLKYVRFS